MDSHLVVVFKQFAPETIKDVAMPFLIFLIFPKLISFFEEKNVVNSAVDGQVANNL